MGTQLPLPKKGHSPQFSAYDYCGQTAGWIKMELGIEVGLGPGHIVLDGDPAPPPQKGGTAPNFQPMPIVVKRSPISAAAEHLYCKPTYSWRFRIGVTALRTTAK